MINFSIAKHNNDIALFQCNRNLNIAMPCYELYRHLNLTCETYLFFFCFMLQSKNKTILATPVELPKPVKAAKAIYQRQVVTQCGQL